MRSIIAIAMAALMGSSAPQHDSVDPNLPVLHKIQTSTLSPSYSCRSIDEVKKGYENTALFVSGYSKERGDPDMIFNGACRSDDTFDSGGAMSLVSDLGEVPLENISAHLAFNPANVAGKDAKFQRRALVLKGHTYALIINKPDFRGLVVFTVDQYVPNKSVRLRYAVKEYQLMAIRTESPGFTWEGKNIE